MTYSIYLVEDEQELNAILTTYLQKEGWEIKSFHNGGAALEAIPERPNLWVLDIMLPDVNGYELLKAIKEDSSSIPVIFISARDANLDRIIGLELGSDDYIAKPFLPKELVLRSKKLLQRTYQLPAKQEKMKYGPYEVDLLKRNVREMNSEIILTSKEYELFSFLLFNVGQAFSREQILQKIWGDDYFGSDRVVDDLLRRMRKKLPALRIETLYGFGYRLIEG
ncbi:response regulator transcription factor [Bacillus sp. DJP31]|uniref:response regulator transcription factor n=1 Tax=Bacillus sp. DJP31 TaxID=3409789 RepID=UPI003BB74209